MLWEWLPSLPHSRPPEHKHFTSQKGKTAYTYETECIYNRTSTYNCNLKVHMDVSDGRAGSNDSLVLSYYRLLLGSIRYY